MCKIKEAKNKVAEIKMKIQILKTKIQKGQIVNYDDLERLEELL